MIDIFVLLAIIFTIVILPIFFIKQINKYKLIGSEDGINKLYEYSKYLILKIENKEELLKNLNYNRFENYIKENDKVFLVLHTNSKIIKAQKIDFILEEKFNNSFNELKRAILNKDLKISIFNMNGANSDEKDFFWSLVNYSSFGIIKYITMSNLTYLFVFIITVSLTLFNILIQKTLLIVGVPLQLSLINIFDFAQFILYSSLCSMGFIICLIAIFLPIVLILFRIIYFLMKPKDNSGNTTVSDHLLFGFFNGIIGFVLMIFALLIYMPFISITKMDFQNSKIKYDNVFTTIGDYIDFTGYPRVGNINGNLSYIAGYDTNSIYFYNLEETNNKFFDFENKEKSQSLFDTCNLISEYKENQTRTNIILLKNQYLKSKYIKSILKKDAVITNEKPLGFSDIIINDIDIKCQEYIKKYK